MSDSAPEPTVTIYADEWQELKAHMARVEQLCALIEGAFSALMNTPFAMALPPDLVEKLRGNSN